MYGNSNERINVFLLSLCEFEVELLLRGEFMLISIMDLIYCIYLK